MKSERTEANYLDFELQINPGTGREYPVSVNNSPAGEARETMHFPFDELTLENRLLALQNSLLRSGGTHRRIPLPEEKTVQDFGKDLFSALICGEIRSRYDVSLSKADQQDKGLRIKLRIQSPELAALPWEFIFDKRYGEYLCLSRETPIVRYIELPKPIQPLSVTLPLRILGMIATPSDLQSLDIEREKKRIEEAVKNLEARDLVELTWLPGQTWRDLQRAMREGPWHIFHFIGHGGFDVFKDEGLICLSDEEGKTHPLSATQLGRLLAGHKPLRLVLLNACEGARGGNRDIFSSTASILVQRGIPAVLAMQYEITDRAAIEFARTFYEALTEGMPIDASVTEARISISLAINNTLEWGTPVLYMRSPDGILFSLAREQKVKTKAQKTPRPARPTEEKPPPLEPADSGSEPVKDKKKPIPQRKPPKAKTIPPPAKPAAEITTIEKDEYEMVLIPEGNFIYGSREDDKEASPHEKPQQTLYLPSFYMGVYPVTNRQYCEFLNEVKPDGEQSKEWIDLSGKSYFDKCRIRKKRSDYVIESSYEEYPIIFVSWYGAEAYAKWAGKRLPYEVEWEKAGRGTDGRKYPWGNEFNKKMCNSDTNGIDHTTPITSYPGGKSPYGCFDMAGNVNEWCEDSWYFNNDKSRFKGDLKGPSTGNYRVTRGGNWNADARSVRCAYREYNDPGVHHNLLGFRLCQDIK